VIALKCLREGGVAPFSRLAWPVPKDGEPGAWVEAEPQACATGIHACLAIDLPYWLAAQLWTIELDEVQPVEHKLVARRGRLLERVRAWDGDAMRDFAFDCVARAEAFLAREEAVAGYIEDARTSARAGNAPVTGFIVARVAELTDGVDGYDAERAAQARWLADRLGLDELG
jgi:hypothetical protein